MVGFISWKIPFKMDAGLRTSENMPINIKNWWFRHQKCVLRQFKPAGFSSGKQWHIGKYQELSWKSLPQGGAPVRERVQLVHRSPISLLGLQVIYLQFSWDYNPFITGGVPSCTAITTVHGDSTMENIRINHHFEPNCGGPGTWEHVGRPLASW